MEDLAPQKKEELYTWIDGFSLSRPKRNIARDFADGVLVAEILHHYFPKLVDIHNYVPANGLNRKKTNWETLNRKVLTKMECPLTADVVEDIVQGKAGVIENVLLHLKKLIEEMVEDDVLLFSPRKSPDKDIKLNSCEIKSSGCTMCPMSLGYCKEPTVPAVLLQETQQEVLQHKETIQVLQAKIDRLEETIKLKDIRIHDLTQQLKQTAVNKLRPVKNPKHIHIS